MKESRMLKPGFLMHLLQRFPENVRGTISTGLLGLAAGLSAVAFLFLTDFLFTQTYLFFAKKSVIYFIIASFIVISVSSLMVGYLLNVLSPEAAGSGIPQIKTAYWKELGHVNFKQVLV